MKFVVISDTHCQHRRMPPLPAGDVLVHCGDFSHYGRPGEVEDFAEWFREQPYAHRVVVAGNHEVEFSRLPLESRRNIFRGCTYLEDSVVEIGEHVIYGSPRTPEFGTWAWGYPRDRAPWQGIPDKTTVLITHGPPSRALDTIRLRNIATPIGCHALRERVSKLPALRAHFFGHVHAQGGRIIDQGGVIFANAAICDEHHVQLGPPIWVDLA